MGTVNIGGGDDEFHRYKMPKLVAKVEGRGNGIKTCVVNIMDIAKALHRPPTYCTKYFGTALCAQSSFNEKSGLAYVNGEHSGDTLPRVLEGFIQKFVMCPNCKLPETDISVEKKDLIFLDCNACGEHSLVDMTDKLCTFIKNHPPGGSQKDSKKNKKEKKDKKDKRKDKDKDSDEDKRKKDKYAAAASTVGGVDRVALAEIADEANGEVGAATNNSNVEWYTDTSKEAMRARKKELAAEFQEKGRASNKLNLDEGTPDEVAEQLRPIIAEAKSSHVVKSLEAIGLDPKERVETAIRAIMDYSFLEKLVKNSDAKIGKHNKKILSQLIPTLAEQREVISTIACLCDEVNSKDAVKLFAKAILRMYENDVVEEEAVVQWQASPEAELDTEEATQAYASALKPLVEWLQTADEESDDDDDDGDD
eukprot:Rmarinus@m.9581